MENIKLKLVKYLDLMDKLNKHNDTRNLRHLTHLTHNEYFERLCDDILIKLIFKYPIKKNIVCTNDIINYNNNKPNYFNKIPIDESTMLVNLIDKCRKHKKYQNNKIMKEQAEYENEMTELTKIKKYLINKVGKYTTATKDPGARHNIKNNFDKLFCTAHLKKQLISGPSTGEKKVMNFLEILSKKFHFCYNYLHKWSFCINVRKLEYDFYCVMYYEERLFHFVIEFDGEQHYERNDFHDYENIHRLDILKQHYLHEMGIHLLRLRKNDNIRKTIVDFINKILTLNTYVITNGIEPNETIINGTHEHNGLKVFYKHYDKTYKLYNRRYYSRWHNEDEDEENDCNDKIKLLDSEEIRNFELFDAVDSSESSESSDSSCEELYVTSVKIKTEKEIVEEKKKYEKINKLIEKKSKDNEKCDKLDVINVNKREYLPTDPETKKLINNLKKY